MSSETLYRPKASIAASLTIVTVIAGTIGCVIALQRHQQFQSEQRYQTIVDRVKKLETAENYSACINEASTIPLDAKAYSQAQRYWQSCQNKLAAIQLKRATERAQKGEFAQAIREASQVSEGSALSEQAQQRIEQWSKRMLEIAEKYYMQPKNRLNSALGILEAIPRTSPMYAVAQARMQQWQQLWTNNEQHWSNAEEALEEQKSLDFALSEAQKITDHPFWTPRRNQMLRAVQEKQLQQKYETAWKTAQSLLAQGEPQNAIEQVRDLPDAYPWSERKQQLMNKAEARQRRAAACQMFSFGLFNCY